MDASEPGPAEAADFLALGQALFAGGAGPSWATRAGRIRALMTTLIGDGGPTAAVLNRAPLPRELPPPLLHLAPHRRTLEETARRLLDHVLSRELEGLEGLLHDEVWVLWPDGTFARHQRAPLLAALASRPGRHFAAIPERLVIYGLAELRSRVARGLPEALSAVLEADLGVVVTAHLDTPRGPQGRVLLVLVPDDRGQWRAKNLPLAAVDEALLGSVKVPAAEARAVQVGDRMVRHWTLGHGPQLRSLRNQMMPKLWLDEEAIDAEELGRRAAAGLHRLEAADVVFGGTEALPSRELHRVLGAPRARRIEREAKKLWAKPLEHWRVELTRTTLGRWDPEAHRAEDGAAVTALLCRTVERDQRGEEKVEYRLGGLFAG